MKKIHILTFVAGMLLAGVYPVYALSPLDFFPYKKGDQIEYDKITNGKKSTIEETCLGIELVNGKEVFAMKNSETIGYMKHEPATKYYVVSKDGIAFIGSRSPGKETPMILDNPHYSLKAPIRVGKSWEYVWKPGYKSVSKIISNNETVMTSAGSFNNCVKVEVQYPPTKSLPLRKETFWYCPGIGLVKAISILKFETSKSYEMRLYLARYIKKK